MVKRVCIINEFEFDSILSKYAVFSSTFLRVSLLLCVVSPMTRK